MKTLSAFVKQSAAPTIDFLLASLMECQTEAAPRHCPAHPRRLTDPRSPLDPRNPHRYMFGLPDGYVLLPYRGVNSISAAALNATLTTSMAKQVIPSVPSVAECPWFLLDRCNPFRLYALQT